MNRRAFIAAVAFALFAKPLTVTAQTAAGVYRLGILHPGTWTPSDPVLLGNWIPEALRELGYIEGQNLIVERKYAEGNFERLPALAHELVQLRVDVILAVGSSSVKAAKEATTTIPIVLESNVDPVAAGLVASLARPGGNVTGVLITPEGTLAAKKLELLKEAVPRASRITFLIPEDPAIGVQQQLQEVRKAASSLGIELHVVIVRGGDYDSAFAAIGPGAAPSAYRRRALFFRAGPEEDHRPCGEVSPAGDL